MAPAALRMLAAGTALVLALAACGGDDGGLGTDDTGPEPADTTLPVFDTTEATLPQFEPVGPSLPPPPPGNSLLTGSDPRQNTQVAAALEDLAGRLGTDPGDIEVVVWDAVTWPDGSIGCPRPGMGYTQVLIEGVRIVLVYDTAEYNYHAAGTGIPFLCEPKAFAEKPEAPKIDVD